MEAGSETMPKTVNAGDYIGGLNPKLSCPMISSYRVLNALGTLVETPQSLDPTPLAP